MRRQLMVVLAALALGAAVAEAAPATLNNSATASQPAQALYAGATDAVSIFNTGELTAAVRDPALAAAADAGATAAVGSGFSAGLVNLSRAGAAYYASRGPGWAFPMSITALPLDAIGATMGRGTSGVIATGAIVMGQSSASLHGAAVGDVAALRTSGGGVASFAVGAILPDAQVGGAEFVMSMEQANVMFSGTALATRVLVYGVSNRGALDAALAARGVDGNPKARIRRSWDAPDPDSTLSVIQTKVLLGEFDIDYANLSLNGWTSMSPEWVAANLPARRTYPTGIRALCHNAVHADLTAALQEVVDAGLAGGIDAANANTYGGCGTGQARFARITGNLGSVSRHSWGQALDTNTVTNCQGCVPQMDCRIVQIFRKHNFAWGGNFLTPDGMHFEWVGERRDGLVYPSRYCPTSTTTSARSPSSQRAAPVTETVGLGTIFGYDGFGGDD
jgi:D-alanyl-D-alanine carboxypeptidase